MHIALVELLNKKVAQYNNFEFIALDPICIPHNFKKQQDIEIAGFFAATLAWGLRKTIINSGNKLMALMDNAPYDFILNHKPIDRKIFEKFAHRTFNANDLMYFIEWLQDYYRQYHTLEKAFIDENNPNSLEAGLIQFYNRFFSLPHLERTYKHVASPIKNSACKRLCMYLRWMVRKDNCGVDFGLWKNIKQENLICPMDVHVSRVSAKLGLIEQPKSNWKTALELTNTLKKLCPKDPCKYDYALFSLGVIEQVK